MNFIFLLNFDRLLESIQPYLLQLGILFGLLFCLMFLGLGAVFKRAGKSAISAWIPFYNLYVLFEIVYQKGWKVVFLLIPFYNLYLLLAIPFKLSKMFGHGILFGIYLLLFPVGGYPILGFEDVVCGESVDHTQKIVLEPENSDESTIKEDVLETHDNESITENVLETPDLVLESFENEDSLDLEIPVTEVKDNANTSTPLENIVTESSSEQQKIDMVDEVSSVDLSSTDDNILSDIDRMASMESETTGLDVSKELPFSHETNSNDSSVLASELSFLDSILSSK